MKLIVMKQTLELFDKKHQEFFVHNGTVKQEPITYITLDYEN